MVYLTRLFQETTYGVIFLSAWKTTAQNSIIVSSSWGKSPIEPYADPDLPRNLIEAVHDDLWEPSLVRLRYWFLKRSSEPEPSFGCIASRTIFYSIVSSFWRYIYLLRVYWYKIFTKKSLFWGRNIWFTLHAFYTWRRIAWFFFSLTKSAQISVKLSSSWSESQPRAMRRPWFAPIILLQQSMTTCESLILSVFDIGF